MFTVSEDWIRNYASNPELGIGWTAKQLALLGVPAQNNYGWIARVSGTQITDSARAQFEVLGIRRQNHLGYNRLRQTQYVGLAD